MLPDINNFSNILDINTANQLQVRMILQTHGQIEYDLQLNEHKITGLDQEIFLDLFSPISLVCSVTNVNNGAVEIKGFTVNKQEILPVYQHLANPPVAWIDKTGIWRMDIPAPFYTWYHEISGQGWVA